MNQYIDLRSDTVTRPSEGMRKAMYNAEVGDDVFREDPTVNELQEYCAALFRKEAALFVSSGVMGNQLCLRVHTTPGDEVICERDAHIFNYESGTPAAISGIQLYPVPGIGGVMEMESVKQAIRPVSAYYMPRTRVIAVENTHNRAGGAVIPLEAIRDIRQLAEANSLITHLDGARIWNASAASGIPLHDYAQYFNSVSACFSKGLGAPVGSVIVGERDFIREAFRLRKAWGGGMRQVGVLAAAALYALKQNRELLPADHERARRLRAALQEQEQVTVDIVEPNTNILLFEVAGTAPADFIEQCKAEGLLLSVGTAVKVRAVTHLDVNDADVDRAIAILRRVLSRK